jgi:hypothetical protein
MSEGNVGGISCASNGAHDNTINIAVRFRMYTPHRPPHHHRALTRFTLDTFLFDSVLFDSVLKDVLRLSAAIVHTAFPVSAAVASADDSVPTLLSIAATK